MSGRCAMKSRTQCVGTSEPTRIAIGPLRLKAKYARPNITPQPSWATRLCEIGNEVKSNGDAARSPGTIRTCSIPNKSRTGHNMSANCAASTKVPSEVFGAAFFAVSATAKWPRNMCLQGRANEIYDKDRNNLRLLSGHVNRCAEDCNSSSGFSGEFFQPVVECGAVDRTYFSKQHAHSEAGVRVDDLAGQFAGAAAISNQEVKFRVHWKWIDDVHVAALRA